MASLFGVVGTAFASQSRFDYSPALKGKRGVFAAVGRLLQRHRGPIFHLIEDLFGQSIVEVHQEIAAALISPALARGLKAKAGAMALEVQRTYRLATGKIAQVAINTHPAARFRHAMTMRRVKA